jgi:hypothetical protein
VLIEVVAIFNMRLFLRELFKQRIYYELEELQSFLIPHWKQYLSLLLLLLLL